MSHHLLLPNPPVIDSVGTGRAMGRGRGRVERLGLLALLLATAVLYLWRLDVSGWANPYYSAAAQAGSQSWKAFFFGSLDAGNAITVDKPPLALWPIDLSVRIFGLSSWSVLVPQALEGVACVGLLHATVHRTSRSPLTALLAGGLFAITPVAALMFRYDNPDAMLVLVLLGAVYATLRAVESPRALRWLVLAGALVGLGFMTKMIEAFLVLPALAAAYAVGATVSPRRRASHLLAALASVALGCGWWVALVQWWPASSRPWIGGSTGNSVLELALGYNGLQRLTGSTAPSTGGASGLAVSELAHVSRIDIAGEVGWLVPAALLLGVATLQLVHAMPGLRHHRAALVLWLLWVVVPGVTFVVMTGTFHSYYTVLLAPALCALVALGTEELWCRRETRAARVVLGVASILTTIVAVAILLVLGEGLRWLVAPIVVLGAGAGRLLLARDLPPRSAPAVALSALLAAALAPLAFTTVTITSPHVGSSPTAGPRSAASAPANPVVPPALVGLLRSGDQDWAAAVPGARTASVLELASGRPVIAIGGYKGTDPAPSLAEFQDLVGAGRVHFYLGAGTPGLTSAAITRWVSSRWEQQSTDGFTYYDLTR